VRTIAANFGPVLERGRAEFIRRFAKKQMASDIGTSGCPASGDQLFDVIEEFESVGDANRANRKAHRIACRFGTE
jgi:hypothetical protein